MLITFVFKGRVGGCGFSESSTAVPCAKCFTIKSPNGLFFDVNSPKTQRVGFLKLKALNQIYSVQNGEGLVTSETTHYVTVFANDAFKLRRQKYQVSMNNLIATVGLKSYKNVGALVAMDFT